MKKKFESDLIDIAEKTSDDIHTKVGCVIKNANGQVIGVDSNHLTRGIEPADEILERPEKYDWIEHAERNAIYSAARNGVSLDGAYMFLPGFPCVECARAIAQSGISRLYCGSTEGWDEERYKFKKSRKILQAAGVKLIENWRK